MTIAIIGTGYVGLTTGACLSDIGHKVICVDNDLEKINFLREGKCPIFETGLPELIQKNQQQNNLIFTDDLNSAVKNSEIVFICVNTPPKPDGQADLKYVEMVARQIAEIITEYKIIVDKSTVPVKTAEKVKETIKKYNLYNADFDVVSNPEFLREGTAVSDTLNPDRIVIGVDSKRAQEAMLKLYEPIIKKNNTPVKIVSVKSAELIKHGANTFLSTKISYANLVAEACEQVGADALEVLEAIGLDKRIGSNFLKPGIGFGGSCFPKDIAAFKKTLEILGVDCSFIEAIEKINSRAWQRFLKKIERELWVLDGKQIGVLGLSFKPGTDDIRNSPAIRIISGLIKENVKIKAYDPKAMAKTQKFLPEIQYCQNAYQAAEKTDALIICTDWDEFKNLDLLKIKNLMTTPVIFDGRNIFNPVQLKQLGFTYFGVGR